MKDIVKHFIELKDVEPVESALSIKLKKLSGGRKLSSKEMVELMAEQMGDSDRREMEDMLAAGASMEEDLKHLMESELNSADRKKMDEMLMAGYSIEEIL